MIEIADIKDRNSLKQWLTDWPRENGLDEDAARAVAVTIAHRAAMRVLPLWWQWTLTDGARKLDLTALLILRCNLISGVAIFVPTPEIKRAASDASAPDSAPDSASDSASDSAFAFAAASVDSAVDSAVSAVSASAAAFAADSAFAAAFAADSAAAVLWEEIRTDCERTAGKQDVFATPLWGNWENPFEPLWHKVKSRDTSPEWAFWIKWYDDALAGTPPNWKMLEQIALIESAVWEEGAEAVADAIAQIQRKKPGTDPTDISAALKALPSPTPKTVAAVRATMSENREELPPTYDAIEALILIEIEQLQQKNYRDDDDAQEAKRQIGIFLTLHTAIVKLRSLVPEVGEVKEAEAEVTVKIWQLYKDKLAELPRTKVDEVIEGAWETGKAATQFGLIAGSAYVATLIGVAPQIGLPVAAMCFAPKKAGDIIKAAKDVVWPKPN